MLSRASPYDFYPIISHLRQIEMISVLRDIILWLVIRYWKVRTLFNTPLYNVNVLWIEFLLHDIMMCV